MNTPIERSATMCAQAQLDAYNALDIDAFVSIYHESIELIDLLTGQVFCNGIGELKARYQILFENNRNLHCKLVSRVCCGAFVYDEELVTGLSSAKEVHAVATYFVENGLIKKAWFVKEEL
ncbi:MAG: nuclear transport factor 2 family protein [Ignavibacteria bacterium]|nr:nuclear transport factor 2 family protein [Ignavibacteria bacterium]